MSLQRFVLSTRDGGQRLSEQALSRHVDDGQRRLPRLVIDTSRRYQTHLGFGGAFTEAAATVWQALPEAQREQLLRDYFDPEHGHGYTLGRVHINSCDFALGNYAHVEQRGRLRARQLQRSSATAAPCCPSSAPRNAWRAARCSCWPRRGARRRG